MGEKGKKRAETPKQNKSVSEAVGLGRRKGERHPFTCIDHCSARFARRCLFSFSVNAEQSTEKISLVEKKKKIFQPNENLTKTELLFAKELGSLSLFPSINNKTESETRESV